MTSVKFRWSDEWRLPSELPEATKSRFLWINYCSWVRYENSVRDGEAEEVFIDHKDNKLSVEIGYSRDYTSLQLTNNTIRICPNCMKYGFVSKYHQLLCYDTCFVCGTELVDTSCEKLTSSLPYHYKEHDITEEYPVLRPDVMLVGINDFKKEVKSKLKKVKFGNLPVVTYYSNGSGWSHNSEIFFDILNIVPLSIIDSRRNWNSEYNSLIESIAESYVSYKKAADTVYHTKTWFNGSIDEYKKEVVRRITQYPDGFHEAVRIYALRNIFNGYSPEEVLLGFKNGSSEYGLTKRIVFASKYVFKNYEKVWAVSNDMLMKNIRKPDIHGKYNVSGLVGKTCYGAKRGDSAEEYARKAHMSAMINYYFMNAAVGANYLLNNGSEEIRQSLFCIVDNEDGTLTLRHMLL